MELNCEKAVNDIINRKFLNNVDYFSLASIIRDGNQSSNMVLLAQTALDQWRIQTILLGGALLSLSRPPKATQEQTPLSSAANGRDTGKRRRGTLLSRLPISLPSFSSSDSP